MSNKKYSDGVWEKKVLEQIGEELKNSGKFFMLLLRIFKLL
jgi:hypothetical protein